MGGAAGGPGLARHTSLVAAIARDGSSEKWKLLSELNYLEHFLIQEEIADL